MAVTRWLTGLPLGGGLCVRDGKFLAKQGPRETGTYDTAKQAKDAYKVMIQVKGGKK